jgi:hypothetical protein
VTTSSTVATAAGGDVLAGGIKRNGSKEKTTQGKERRGGEGRGWEGRKDRESWCPLTKILATPLLQWHELS